MRETVADSLDIRAVGVIGAGLAGREFARECVCAGYTVFLEDVMPARLRQARMEIGEAYGCEVAGSLELVTTVEDAVRSVDLMVDFVPDELESKLEILSMADRMAPPRTILCTPTDVLSIADLASCVYRPEQCLAVRELSGPEVCVVTHSGISVAALAAVERLLRRLGRAVVFETDRALPMLTKNVVGAERSGQ